MRQHYQTTAHKARRAALTALGAAAMLATSLALLLAYFDVLTK